MKFLTMIIVVIIVLCAWSPWLTAEQAINLVNAKAEELKNSNPDLCELFIDEYSVKKVLFGYTEKVSYDCAETDEVLGVPKADNTVFITFYKGLIGMPNKSVVR